MCILAHGTAEAKGGTKCGAIACIELLRHSGCLVQGGDWQEQHAGNRVWRYRVVDARFVAELAVGPGVDQHLAASGGGAVCDDLGVQVHVALVECCQRRSCTTPHLCAEHT